MRLSGVRIADTFMISSTFEITWLFFSNKQRSVLRKVNNCDIRGVKNYFTNLSDFRKTQSELGQVNGILSQLEKNSMSTKKIESLKDVL